MPGKKGITVTKSDEHTFTVHFPKPVTGPGSHKAGDDIPVEWMRGALDYYIQHRDASGALPEDAHKKVKALW